MIATAMFGERLDLARSYAEMLAGAGIERGLLGPREVSRLWERHLLNCAALADLLPTGARVVDIGSGAGLPGIALAVRRPDLRVDLVEPLQRRVDFLREAVAELGLSGSVRVVHGRAEDDEVRRRVGDALWVTARAVAPLDRLVRWCLPLLRPGGRLLAMKGDGAHDEVARHAPALRRLGARDVQVISCGVPPLPTPVTVVTCQRTSTATGTRRDAR